MWRHPLFVLSICGLAWWWYSGSSLEAVTQADGSFDFPGYEISAVQPFDLEARVLSRRNYSSGRESELSPTDLGIGWGRLTEDRILADIDFYQRNRWMFWKSKNMPLPKSEISSHAANVHIIPANQLAEGALANVREGDRVRLRGTLVDVRAGDGWRWRTSRSLTDSGDGACELLWLENIDWL